MKKRNLKLTVTACALAGVLMVGGIMAYFTDGDTATNTFTVGKVSIDLQEPSWDPDDVTQITPEEEFAKDPQVKNDGINDAYVFVEVLVPYAEVVTANEAGEKQPLADTQLFTWDVNDGWYLLESDTTDADATGNYRYLYAYGAADAMTAVAKDATTESVFDYVRFANVVEDEGLEETDLDIVINAYAIQTANINDADADIDGVNNDGKVAPADVWAVLSTQAPSTAQGAEDAKTDIKA